MIDYLEEIVVGGLKNDLKNDLKNELKHGFKNGFMDVRIKCRYLREGLIKAKIFGSEGLGSGLASAGGSFRITINIPITSLVHRSY